MIHTHISNSFICSSVEAQLVTNRQTFDFSSNGSLLLAEPLDFIIQKDVCVNTFSKFFDDIDKDYKK